MLTDSELTHIYLKISNGRGNHGDFLRTFAEALLRADSENFQIMRKAAYAISVKYNLSVYLDTYKVDLDQSR